MTAAAAEQRDQDDARQRPARLRRRWLVVAAVLPVVLLAAWALIFLPRVTPQSGPIVGNLAPELDLTGLDGSPVRLADLRGHPVLVNFWASWCAPCVEEFPLIQSAADTHAADGLVVVGVVYQDSADAARAFMQQRGATWSTALDPDGTAAASYEIIGPPESFFIDANGIIAGRQIGQLTATDLDLQLTKIIAKE